MLRDVKGDDRDMLEEGVSVTSDPTSVDDADRGGADTEDDKLEGVREGDKQVTHDREYPYVVGADPLAERGVHLRVL